MRWTRFGAEWIARPPGRCSARRRSFEAATVWRARAKALIAEWKVPPEKLALLRT